MSETTPSKRRPPSARRDTAAQSRTQRTEPSGLTMRYSCCSRVVSHARRCADRALEPRPVLGVDRGEPPVRPLHVDSGAVRSPAPPRASSSGSGRSRRGRSRRSRGSRRPPRGRAAAPPRAPSGAPARRGTAPRSPRARAPRARSAAVAGGSSRVPDRRRDGAPPESRLHEEVGRVRRPSRVQGERRVGVARGGGRAAGARGRGSSSGAGARSRPVAAARRTRS